MSDETPTKYRVVKVPHGAFDTAEVALIYRDREDKSRPLMALNLPEEVTEPFFVLMYDDPIAQDALWVYANLIKKKNPELAEHIKEQIAQAVESALQSEGSDERGPEHP